MIGTFIYVEKGLWRWYVLIEDHVLDQGTAKTDKGAVSKAERSKEFFERELQVL